MYIRPYADLPGMYAPDIGEVLLGRRTPADRWTRAVVLDVRRTRAALLRVKVQWMEDNPDAGAPEHGRPKQPIVAGTPGVLVYDPDLPLLVKRIDRDQS